MAADRCGDCSGVPEAGSRAQARLTRRQTHKGGRRCRGAGKGNDKNKLQPSHFMCLLKSVRWSHLNGFEYFNHYFNPLKLELEHVFSLFSDSETEFAVCRFTFEILTHDLNGTFLLY